MSTMATDAIIRSRSYVTGENPDERIKHIKHYQVYRGLSPATSNRLEARVKELEDALETERELRLRAERGLTEITIEAEGLSERLDEADGLTSAQIEAVRRRDQEILKLKKDLELLHIQHDAADHALRKRHQEAINALTEQLEQANKFRNRGDKDKQQLHIEIDLLSNQCDQANKARSLAEGKLESLDDQLRRLKAQVDDLTRANGDLNAVKIKQAQDIHDLQRQLQELDANNAHLAKAKAQLQALLDELKARVEDESNVKNQYGSQLNSLQIEFDNLSARLDEADAENNNLKGQLQKALGDYQLIKNKYDTEVVLRVEELDDLRRKSGIRIVELEELAEQARARANKLEKEKLKLQIEIKDYCTQLESANLTSTELSRKLKGFEGSAGDLHRRVEELTFELSNANGENQKHLADLVRLNTLNAELNDKNNQLARENKHLTDSLRDALSQNSDLSRQVQELNNIRIQLQSERDTLALELADAKEALKDALARLDAANNALNQIKTDFELRLRGKDEELENLRKSSQRAIHDLQSALVDIENKLKGEISRLKKKHDTDLREWEIQLDALTRNNAELAKNNKALVNRLKELELLLEEERRAAEDARQAAANWERKWVTLHSELESLRAQLEASERARRHAESELGDSSGRFNNLNITITNLTGEKKRLESDLQTLSVELESHISARRSAEERADKLQLDFNRLLDELRAETENARRAEAARKQLESELRELHLKLEDSESYAGKEGKRLVAKLQTRLKEVELELEAEQRRGKDLQVENRKLQRLLQELKVQYEDEHRLVLDLTDQVNNLTLKNKALRKQIEEVEEVVGITINKYRKGQQQLEEAERRADDVERSFQQVRAAPLNVARIHVGAGVGVAGLVPPSAAGRSLSVSREVHRVVRV